MANQIEVQPGGSRDVLSGDGYGVDQLAGSQHLSAEHLVGEQYGIDLFAEAVPAATREVVSGDALGTTWFSGGVQIIREAIIKEPPFKAAHASREVLVSIPNEGLTIARVIGGYGQAVVAMRPAMPAPSAVKSPHIVPTLRMNVGVRATREWSISDKFASTLCMQSVMRRFLSYAPDMWSVSTIKKVAQQITLSRGKIYVPVSELRVKTGRQQVTQRRDFTPAPQVRTAIVLRGLVQQMIASRAEEYVPITTDADVGQFVEQVVRQNVKVAPHSETRTSKLVHMVVQVRDVVAPGIDDRVAQLNEQVVVPRVPTPPFGAVRNYAMRSQVLIGRDTLPQRSVTRVGAAVAMTVMVRDTVEPAYALGRHTGTLVQQAMLKRAARKEQGYRHVASVRMSFTIGRDVPAPWDVIDPSIGRHAYTLAQVVVQERIVEPPVSVKESRWVHGVYCQAVVGDKFPLPDYPPAVPPETRVNQVVQVFVRADANDWVPVSAVTSQQLAQGLVIGDAEGWIDATIPQSEVQMAEITQSVAVSDLDFPDSMASLSHAVVPAVVSHFAHSDQFPDPAAPQSEIEARQVIEFAALGDLELPDPAIPLSSVTVRHLGAITVLPDPALTGHFDGSDIRQQSVVEFLVLPDRSLMGISLRKGPRPQVSVSVT